MKSNLKVFFKGVIDVSPLMIPVVPFGLIFACFMTAVMGGSLLFSYLLKEKSLEELPIYIHGSATVASFLTALFTGNQYLTCFTFVVFEGVCGCFFPTFGTLRGTYIPEDTRTTVMNLFRIPLNLYVVILFAFQVLSDTFENSEKFENFKKNVFFCGFA